MLIAILVVPARFHKTLKKVDLGREIFHLVPVTIWLLELLIFILDQVLDKRIIFILIHFLAMRIKEQQYV